MNGHKQYPKAIVNALSNFGPNAYDTTRSTILTFSLGTAMRTWQSIAT